MNGVIANNSRNNSGTGEEEDNSYSKLDRRTSDYSSSSELSERLNEDSDYLKLAENVGGDDVHGAAAAINDFHNSPFWCTVGRKRMNVNNVAAVTLFFTVLVPWIVFR